MKLVGIVTATLIALAAPSCVDSGISEKTQLEGRIGASLMEKLKNASVVTIEMGNETKKSFNLNTHDRKALAGALTQDRSYIFDRTKSCFFIPEFTLTFCGGDSQEVVIFSHACKQLKFVIEQGRAVILDCDPIAEVIQNIID